MAFLGPLRYTLLALLAAAALAAAAPVLAQDLVDEGRLDLLFAELAYALDEEEAQDVTNEIWDVWTHPDDPDLAELMDQSALFSQTGQLDEAIAVLNQVIAGWPHYAEGWNRRATLNYVIGNFDAALDDIAEALAREPRHFGALSGRMEIELALGEDESARATMIEALHIHPFLAGRERFLGLPQPMLRL